MTSRFILPIADVGAGITPSSGAQLFFYETGTTTPKDTYSDSAGTIPNANPVVANSLGQFPDIFITGTYKVVLKNSAGVQSWVADPVEEGAFTRLAATNGTALITHTQSGIDYNLKTYLGNRFGTNVKDYGAVGDGVTDDSAAFAAAKAALTDDPVNADPSGTIYAPKGNYYLATGFDLSSGVAGSGSLGLVGDGQSATQLIVGLNQIGLQNAAHKVENLSVWSKPTWDASVTAGAPAFGNRDTTGVGVHANGRVKFKNVTAYGFGTAGFDVDRMIGGLIEALRVTDCGSGVRVGSTGLSTTTSTIRNCYISNCDIGMDLTNFRQSEYSSNITELCDTGLKGVTCSATAWVNMYFEKCVTYNYDFLNTFPNFVGPLTISDATVPATERNIYNASISASDMSTSFTQADQFASTNLGMLSYDNAAASEKGLKYNQFKMTGASNRFRGLRVLDRDTASGTLDPVGTFQMVNGAKAAHTSIIQVKADGTVLDSDGMIATVSKLATGEYSLNLAASTHPDHVNIATYQVYTTGATPVRNAQWSMSSANLTTHETGRAGLVQKIYVTITDAGGTLQDSGFTAMLHWNRSDDLTS